MAQSLSRIIIHLVFSTKLRTPWLKDPGLRKELYPYLGGILRDNVDSPSIIINGVEDHVHMLFVLSRKFAPMDVVKEVKTESSKWVKRKSGIADFTWQSGYGAFSIGESDIPDVKTYIQNQESHHRFVTFQDEFRELCRKHGVELDERYVWD